MEDDEEVPTPRQLAREQNLARIKSLALAQLASQSAAELSLRAIARDLGIVSSAIYRYYPSRDDLLTDLIVEGYIDLADAITAANRPTRRSIPRVAFTRGCAALRGWATEQPQRFALLYGTAIPGYSAPQRTIEPAGRVAAALVAPLAGATPSTVPTLTRGLAAQDAALRSALHMDSPAGSGVVVAGVLAELIGILTLELGGHFVGTFDPTDTLYDALVARAADALGL